MPRFGIPRLLLSLLVAFSIVEGLRARAVMLTGMLSCAGETLVLALVGHQTPCLLVVVTLVRLLNGD